MSESTNQPSKEPMEAGRCSRRSAIRRGAGVALAAQMVGLTSRSAEAIADGPAAIGPRPWVTIRGVYGGFPNLILEQGKTPQDFGINAIWVGSGGLQAEEIGRYHKLGLKVFAEFNSMHHAAYLEKNPDAAPLGPDGKPSPPPHGWQGVSPFHVGYRRDRMAEFRRVLETFDIDGIWLDYHHAHASWERDEPALPDTDFCPAALQQFTERSKIKLPSNISEAARLLLGRERDAWTQFRCDVFTDWVREYREILHAVRPGALLGTFHCPWSQDERAGAIRHKLAIDLPAQAKYLDVFSIMPYHARFGHVQDPEWIARQTAALGKLLNLRGLPGEKQKIWPIVQLADWGEAVPLAQLPQILDYATRLPSTGVTIFHWSGLSTQPEKLHSLGKVYRAMGPKGE